MSEVQTANADRLQARLEKVADISESGPGITRPGYSILEREAHKLFATWMDELGCTVWEDPAGNTIAEFRGRNHEARAIGTGSHLDSVYQGGRFDGIAGVVAGVELVHMLKAAGGTNHPVRVVAFTTEEGARFGQACVGSKLAAGLTDRQTLDRLTDRDGITVAQAMRRVGVDPDEAASTPWSREEWSVFLELHVEQGKVLEEAEAAVGPVELISGSTRLVFTMTGRPSHTGGTPMWGRSDALAAASEAVLIAEDLASGFGHRGTRATVGRMKVEPNSITTIPGRVNFSLDVRDIDADRQRRAVTQIVSRVAATCRRRGVGLDVDLTADTSPVVLPLWVRNAFVHGAQDLGMSYRVLTSGASHDAQMINTLIPSGMLFVPSRDGLSHVPEEWTETKQIAEGVEVLYRAVNRLDSLLTEPRGTGR